MTTGVDAYADCYVGGGMGASNIARWATASSALTASFCTISGNYKWKNIAD